MVIIIGAGIAGCTLALELKKRNIDAIVCEAKSRHDCYQGLFIGITPNGLNVLKEHIDINKLSEKGTSGKMKFFNAKNKCIGDLDNKYQRIKYGAETFQIKRADLLLNLHEELEKNEIPLFFEHKFSYFKEEGDSIRAYFENGKSFSGFTLIGADGIHSKVRNQLFPSAPKPVYTKQISTGGFTSGVITKEKLDFIKMVFGREAFFAFAQDKNKEIWWFNNYYREKEPTKSEIKNKLQKEVKSGLLKIHKDDPEPIFEIIENAQTIFAYPVYEYTQLERWHNNKVCLIGDAAHATSPHIGQGASMALEDAAILAKLLATSNSLSMAFINFQNQRQPRVNKLIANARKVGNAKTKPNRFATFFRDIFLKYFIKKESQKMDWIYSYKVQSK